MDLIVEGKWDSKIKSEKNLIFVLADLELKLSMPDWVTKPGLERGAVDRNINQIRFEESYSPRAQDIWELCHGPFWSVY